ncbi:MAG TPA: anion permease, partial [Vicinamibacterales bacterium]
MTTSVSARRQVPWRALLPVAVGVGVALLPVPSGLAPQAWQYFALFVAVVVGLVLEPVPAAG